MYKHAQIGWVIIIFAVSILVFLPVILPRGSSAADAAAFGVPFGIGLLALVLFSTLTVTVDNESVAISFGVGLIRRKLLLKDIVSFRAIRDKWWWGWGIHGYPGKGWLYNVSGLDSVEVTMKNGMKYLIGTDEPGKLCEAIRKVK